MIITFYDKNFNALQDNASLNVGQWNLTRRAVDFDDFTATSEPFLENINPTFIVLKDNYGRYRYGAFAGIPELTKDNQTSLQASDLKTIFNNDIVAAFGTYSYVKDYFEDVFSYFDAQCVQGSFTIDYDIDALAGMDMLSLKPETVLKSYNVWEELIVPYLKYYDCFIETKLNVKQKKIIFTIKRCNNKTIPLRLWEFNIRNYGKYITSINEAQGAVIRVWSGGTKTDGIKWILTSDNAITTIESNRDLYPIKRKVILKEANTAEEYTSVMNEANMEALRTLVEARYQESFTIPVDNDQRYENIDFDTTFRIFAKPSVFYKYLPLGEIIEDNTGKKTLKIGYKPDDIVYYF